MVSKDHKKRVLDYQAARAADAHSEKPLVMYFGGCLANGPDTPVTVEDTGQAMILEVDMSPGSEDGLFVRIQSWDTNREHADFRKLIGHKIEVMIRTID